MTSTPIATDVPADVTTDVTTDVSAYVDGAAALLGLTIDPAHRPGVLRYFALAADMAALVEAVPLEPRHEAAVHFTPISPRVAGDGA